MEVNLLNDRDVKFLMYEVYDVEKLLTRPRYQDHSRETFDSSLETAKKIAEKYFGNHYAKGDACQPSFDGQKVTLVEETQAAWDAVADAGFLSAPCSYDEGGMQLPDMVIRLVNAYLYAANAATAGYSLLCVGAAHLIEEFGSDEQRNRFLPHMRNGRFCGTMALTEPSQGSSLQDISTKAKLTADGTYRLYGQKMYISGGDHELAQNIIHMILAKTVCQESGREGISLFICPKYLIDEDGEITQPNDVALVGLLHKMGFRNATSTVLNFGEKEGAEAYLVGELNQGLSYMFQMMNEARINVGMFAAVLGYQGFNYSLAYAKERRQGRKPALSGRERSAEQVEIIEHADVKRMLLMQKSYSEVGLAMTCYASALYEDSQTGETDLARSTASMLLDLVTPVVKSWPSKYCLKANDLAIQVLGGAGYIQEHLVEQYYRDNRLNPIHEGTEGIQAIDLLGRKVAAHEGRALEHLLQVISQDALRADGYEMIEGLGASVLDAVTDLREVTCLLLGVIAEDREKGLANATIYLDLFGRVFAAWIWLQQAEKSVQGMAAHSGEDANRDFYIGKLQAARFYINWELPEIKHQRDVLEGGYSEPLEMKAQWF
jgi:butyryl-CoA dehydrogenase